MSDTEAGMSETPRTDAAEQIEFGGTLCSPGTGLVSSKFARTLERDLTAARQRIEGLEAERAVPCQWAYDGNEDYYATTCGGAFCLTDGTPEENNMKFCPYCSHVIKEKS